MGEGAAVLAGDGRVFLGEGRVLVGDGMVVFLAGEDLGAAVGAAVYSVIVVLKPKDQKRVRKDPLKTGFISPRPPFLDPGLRRA